MSSISGVSISQERRVPDEEFVLSIMDTSEISRFHIKAVLLSGVGFFTDAYCLFSIVQIIPMLEIVYFNGVIPYTYNIFISISALVGTLIGQIAFGVFGDFIGRKKSYLFTLIIMIFAIIGQSFSSNLISGLGIVPMICIWRLILGFGIGGDYPLSATITSEYSNSKHRGALIAAVFSMQGLGLFLSPLISLVLILIFKNKIIEDVNTLDTVWRIISGLGCIPAILTIYARSLLPEPPRYTLHVNNDLERARSDVSEILDRHVYLDRRPNAGVFERQIDRISWSSLKEYLSNRKHALILFGTCSSWLILDIAFYSQNLLIADILTAIGFAPDSIPGDNMSAYERVYKNALGYTIISLVGTVPGYYFAVAFIDKIGRVTLQYIGFAIMSISLIIIALTDNILEEKAIWAFFLLYGVTFFFANFGPNTTTFVIPAEVFPTKYRATCHGLSAACGKIGAIIGLLISFSLRSIQGDNIATGLLGGIMFLGLFCTYFIPETKGKTLEEINNSN
jgi:PHS family inorganic phosphate transporter-like MFS transporter